MAGVQKRCEGSGGVRRTRADRGKGRLRWEGDTKTDGLGWWSLYV